MSFGLARGRELDPSAVAVTATDLPPLPDDVLNNPGAALVDPRRWFTHPERPLEIEIGSGKGTFLVQQAAQTPERNYLGIEWAREFFVYAADRIRRNALSNVRLLNSDASEFLHWRVPDETAHAIHVYFPDPWPKSRHHRRRMVQDRFMSDARRILVRGGSLHIVTDHEEYWAWMQDVFARWTGENAPPDRRFEPLPFSPPLSAGEGEVVGTNFERKYRREAGGERPFHAITLLRPLT